MSNIQESKIENEERKQANACLLTPGTSSLKKDQKNLHEPWTMVFAAIPRDAMVQTQKTSNAIARHSQLTKQENKQASSSNVSK